MNQELEIEFKNLLTQGEFEQLLNYFHISEQDFMLQENHYFDTPSFQLRDHGCALRIRQKNGSYILTLKQPADTGLLESHEPLTEEQACDLIKGGMIPSEAIYQIIKALHIDPCQLKYFGTLKTSRAEVPYERGILVLDHSTYLGKEDYELEYEVREFDEGQNNFFQLLKTLNIPIRSAENKVKRFYSAKFDR
ncbi:CYTH domain-containing protein [Peribacillus deserti]|uniref:CYTH domain-containing protein n=1 Tax=Peribacillus deserti TaxID=673318 RepID=A0A2N5M7N6_9BACI|nr:CYTH domain-containing protein [Peribacillus deserti]PLT30366.1 CYTH domain-containing protein [Peribacillus deserti]